MASVIGIFKFLVFLTSLASADDFSNQSIDRNSQNYDQRKVFRAYDKKGPLGFGSNYSEFPTLKNPPAVAVGVDSLKPVRGYSHPSLIQSGSTNSMYHCDYQPGLRGKMLYAKDNFVAVQLPCPDRVINGKEGDDVVFFPANQVSKSQVSDEEAKTEAAFVGNPTTEKSDRLLNVPTEKIEGAVSAKSLVSERSSNAYFNSTEEYLRCYPTPNQENYNKHIKPALELASKEFRVAMSPVTGSVAYLEQGDGKDPIAMLASEKVAEAEGTWIDVHPHPDILKCMIRKESLFDPAATSQTGAAGLGQQVSQNVEEINCMLYGCGAKNKRRAALPWAAKMKDSFYNQARKLPESTQSYLWTNAKTGARCGDIMKSKEDAYCPIHSIMATALYQVKLETIIRKNYDKLKTSGDFEGDELILASAMMASGHNAGEGNISKATQNGDPDQWLTQMLSNTTGARTKEVRGYFKSMKACVGGDKQPMSANETLDRAAICHKLDPFVPKAEKSKAKTLR